MLCVSYRPHSITFDVVESELEGFEESEFEESELPGSDFEAAEPQMARPTSQQGISARRIVEGQ